MTERATISHPLFSTLSYRKSGSGPVLLLLHGFPEDGGLWREVAPKLSEQFTVICPDLPGTGESGLPEGALTVELMADAVKAIADAEAQEQQYVLAGHSMGGYVAFAFAEKYSERLSGLSLVHSTAAPDNEEKKETRRKAIALIRKGGAEAFLKGMVPGVFSPATREERPDLIQEQLQRALRLAPESLVAFYEAMIKRPDRSGILHKAAFPVQWIFGKDDSTIPPEGVLPQTHFADRNFIAEYPETGHMSMLEQPARLAEDLAVFVQYCQQQKI